MSADGAQLSSRQDAQTPAIEAPISKTGLSALIWVELMACLFFVALRTWVQYRNSKRLFGNDYLIFVALACHVGAVITCQLGVQDMYTIEQVKLVSAAGQQPSEDMIAGAERFLGYQFALVMLLWTTLWTVKFSLLTFFWRLFDSVRTRMRAFWWIMISITASTFITTIFLQLFACGSPQNFLKIGGCTGRYRTYLSNLVFLFSAGVDIAGDTLIVFIPFPLLWKLRTSQRDKMILVGIFLLPIVPVIFGVVRLIVCNPNPDSGVVNVIKFQLFSLLENTAAIITASLPSLRLFVTSSRNNSKNNEPAYYAAASAKRSVKSQHVVDAIPLGSRVNVSSGEPFDTRMFSRIESEEEAVINDQGRPLRGVVVNKTFELAKGGPARTA